MKKIHFQKGFTMIELLIVITILGILAVAVLSAINPIEQINRGRDTGSQSDAEQLLSAIDRYNAFQGFFPWQVNADDENLQVGVVDAAGELVPVEISEDSMPSLPGLGEDSTCTILERLSTGDPDFEAGEGADDLKSCSGSQEIKESFVTRLLDDGTRTLYIYNNGDQGSSTYVCFIPQSGAFKDTANTRCGDSDGTSLPDDIDDAAAAYICGSGRADDEGVAASAMHCLP